MLRSSKVCSSIQSVELLPTQSERNHAFELLLEYLLQVATATTSLELLLLCSRSNMDTVTLFTSMFLRTTVY